MRLRNYLQEGVIRSDISFFKVVIPQVRKECVGKSPKQVLLALDKIFKPYNISFDTTNKASADDWSAEVGLSDCSIEKRPPFKIVVLIDDFSIFSDSEDFDLWETALARLLKHELLHREQLSRVNLEKKVEKQLLRILKGQKTKPEKILDPVNNRKEYLSNPNEIMALAYDTYLFLVSLGYTPAEIKNVIKGDLEIEDLSNLSDFMKLFPKGSTERNRLLKYIYQYVDSQ